MLIPVCKAKIHRATVTQADLNYVGSITIDELLLEASGIVPNGFFWRTYAMAGKRGHGDICLNGPPARHFQPGDKIIILAEVQVSPEEMVSLDPVVVFVDDQNKVTEVKKHGLIPHPLA